MAEILIFKAGKYPQGDWPKERVRRMVDAYDPEKNLEAPAVIGHRFFNNSDEAQYAHGWVRSLRMDGTGKVWADIRNFTAEALKAMAEKKLRYVSAEIYEFDKIDEKEPPYLRAVALLGRDSPQIPAARLPSLFGVSGSGTVATVSEKKHITAFTRKVKAGEIQTLSKRGEGEEEKGMDETLEELRAELERSKAELAAFKKENGELKIAGAKQESETFFGKLRDEGKLPPALFEKAAALDARLGEEERGEFRALFGQLEKIADLSGAHAADKKNAAGSAAGWGLAAKIRAFQKEHNISGFAEAADALFAERPDLFEEGEGGKA